MKLLQITFLFSALSSAAAFSTVISPRRSSFALKMSSTPLMDLPSTKAAKEDLIDTAERLKEKYGLFLIDKNAKKELKDAVEELENLSEPPAFHEFKKELIGDWELVCTTASDQEGIDTSKLPFFDAGPLKQIRDSITKTANKYLKVQQKIKADPDSGVIDRIDHVLQYQPPAELQDVLDNLPGALSSVDINPLHVSKSELVLIHKAKVAEDDVGDLKINLSLKSIVLNVAGTSTFLDPNGKDLAGINLPLGEFLNTGSFETTYMDEDVRISRGKQGFVDQLRVFVRAGRVDRDAALRDIEESETTVGKGVDADMDVDESVDPEFIKSDDSPSDVEPGDEI